LSDKHSMTYKAAGVDIEAGNRFVNLIRPLVKATNRPEVLTDIGGFGGLFSLNTRKYPNPVLVASTDGVGTKLKLAFQLDRHDTVGIDLVAMCVNDVAVQGAKPLFFLDYLAMGVLNTEVAVAIVEGIAEGCRRAGCSLIGGETAEMPGFYQPNEYDLAGFSVGIVDNAKIIDGSEIRVGNQLIGIGSSGVHSNGYSMVRKICFDILHHKVGDYIPEFGKTLGEELLTPTIIYSETVQSLMKAGPLLGLAHITGGGISDNLVRVLPKACSALIRKGSWPVPPIFEFLQKGGNLEEFEMMRTFNNGIGMIAVVPEELVPDMLLRLKAMNETGWVIGEIIERKDSSSQIEWV